MFCVRGGVTKQLPQNAEHAVITCYAIYLKIHVQNSPADF